jgi:probable HAF family extracellular repeat protein
MTKICKNAFPVMLAFVALVATSGTALAGWTVTDLGTLSDWGTSTATAINNNGQVVGYASTGEYSSTGLDINHAFMWSSSTGMQDLGVIGGSSTPINSYAYGINDSGQIVGTSQLASGGSNSYAFLYSNSSMQNLNILGSANGINNSGQIVGSNLDTTHAFLRQVDGTLQDLKTYSTYSLTRSYATAINNSGQIAAYDSLGSGQGATATSWIWTNGSKLVTGTLGGTNSTIYGINNAGQVVGTAETSGATYTHAFWYWAGQKKDLGTLGDTSKANGINDNGQIVGLTDGVFDDGGITHAALWTINADGSVTLTDLNSLVAGSGWVLAEATSINDKGQIVGWGTIGEGFDAQTHAFLLSDQAAPVPLPPAMYMFGSALIGLIGVRRRFKSSEQ